jgi:hypothetical protein
LEQRQGLGFSFPALSIECVDITEEAQCWQLLTYSESEDTGVLKEEMLYLKELMTTVSSDVLFIFLAYLKKIICQGKLVSVCTDGVPAAIGCRSGFVTWLKSDSTQFRLTAASSKKPWQLVPFNTTCAMR